MWALISEWLWFAAPLFELEHRRPAFALEFIDILVDRRNVCRIGKALTQGSEPLRYFLSG